MAKNNEKNTDTKKTTTEKPATSSILDKLTVTTQVIENSAVTHATLFLKGAQITRTAKINVKKGTNILVFDNLPTNINQQSLWVGINGDLQMLSVSNKVISKKINDFVPALKEVNEKIIKLEEQVALINTEISILEFERENLVVNRDITGGKDNIDAQNFKSLLEYSVERMTFVGMRVLEKRKKLTEINEELHILRAQAGIYSNSQYIQVTNVTIETFAKADATVTMQLRYFCADAYWTPYYDVRVDDINKKTQFITKATTYQNTKENWDNISLILSTSSPSVNMIKPTLNPWYLNFDTPMIASGRQSFNAPVSMMSKKSMKISEINRDEFYDDIAIEESAEILQPEFSVADSTVVSDGLASVEYIIDGKVSLLYNDQKSIDVAQNTLDTEFTHFNVRKIDKEVYILGTIKNLDKLNILKGTANIYLNNNFISTTYIDPRTITDVFEIALGTDASVTVTRFKGKEFNSKSAFGGTKKSTLSIDLKIKNLKSQDITIVVLDQVPVTLNKAINVEVLEDSKAEFNKDKGELKWVLTLKPNELVEKTIKYQVSYPSDKSLLLE